MQSVRSNVLVKYFNQKITTIRSVFILIIISLSVESGSAQIPVYIWAKTLLGNVETIQRGTVVDNFGNVFITGVFFGTVDFDPNAPLVNITTVPYGCNAYIAKYDQNGNFLWIRNIYITASYGNNSIAIDGNNNVYITGYYTGTATDFDPGAGIVSLTSVGGNDIYIAKYDNNGNYIWAKSIGSAGDDRGNEVITDPAGNVFVTGIFSGTVDFDPGAGVSNLNSSGSTDIFFLKLTGTGNFCFAKQIGGAGADDVRDIAVNSGNLYLTGCFNVSADFDPGAGVVNLNSAGNTDIFFAKYDSAGNYLWANSLGSTGADCGTALSLNATGNIVLTGTFNGTVDFDAGSGIVNMTSVTTANSYILKYNSTGVFQWVKRIPLNVNNIDVMFDLQGTIFIAGSFASGSPSIIDMDPGAGTANLSVPSNLPPPYYNIFGRYDASGNYLWADVFGHTCYCSVMGYKSSMTTDAIGHVYYSQIFNGSAFGSSTVDFNPGTGVSNLIAPSSVDNAFFAKYQTSYIPLPIELISFTGENHQDRNELRWITASEINNDYFEIEKSSNGYTFENIGIVKSKGFSDHILKYEFTDESPLTGLNYYRLKQVDVNGEFTYSKTIVIKASTNLAISVTPNPFINFITIEFRSAIPSNTTILIYDAMGKLIKKLELLQLQPEVHSLNIDLSGFNKGIYFCKIVSNENILVKKILKN